MLVSSDGDRTSGETAAATGTGACTGLGQRLHHDRVDRRRHDGVVVGRRPRGFAYVLVGDRDGAVPDERRSAGQQLVEQAAG